MDRWFVHSRRYVSVSDLCLQEFPAFCRSSKLTAASTDRVQLSRKAIKLMTRSKVKGKQRKSLGQGNFSSLCCLFYVEYTAILYSDNSDCSSVINDWMS